jgi:hypothetical protein
MLHLINQLNFKMFLFRTAESAAPSQSDGSTNNPARPLPDVRIGEFVSCRRNPKWLLQ